MVSHNNVSGKCTPNGNINVLSKCRRTWLHQCANGRWRAADAGVQLQRHPARMGFVGLGCHAFAGKALTLVLQVGRQLLRGRVCLVLLRGRQDLWLQLR